MARSTSESLHGLLELLLLQDHENVVGEEEGHVGGGARVTPRSGSRVEANELIF